MAKLPSASNITPKITKTDLLAPPPLATKGKDQHIWDTWFNDVYSKLKGVQGTVINNGAGSTGPQGPAGQAGVSGSSGQPGTAGSTGLAGTDGSTFGYRSIDGGGADSVYVPTQIIDGGSGATGGQFGVTGINTYPDITAGPAGVQGMTGPAGPYGYTGMQGMTGMQGETGPAGSLLAHCVADNTARDAIPAGRREVGMFVYVLDVLILYQLVGGITNSDWKVFTGQHPAISFTPLGGFGQDIELTIGETGWGTNWSGLNLKNANSSINRIQTSSSDTLEIKGWAGITISAGNESDHSGNIRLTTQSGDIDIVSSQAATMTGTYVKIRGSVLTSVEVNDSGCQYPIISGEPIGSGNGAKMAFFNGVPQTKATISGSRASNAALASLLTALHNMGLITDNTSAT